MTDHPENSTLAFKRGAGLENKTQKAALEAILFAYGDAVEQERLATALETDVPHVREILKEMMKDYEEQERGIRLIELDGSWQLCTRKELYEYLIRIAKTPKKITLTDVVMETLSIIAYKQPITRIEIEKIRGVKCDFAVNRLVEFGLVRELGRLDAPGHPILFGTTEEFLRHFGISTLDDLPSPDTLDLEEFREEAQQEVAEKLNI